MGDLVPISQNDVADLFERAATHYVEMLEENGKPPRIGDVYDRMHELHPRLYTKKDKEQFLIKLRTKEFNNYLTERRKSHIVETMAPRLLAAHLGSKLGQLAMERLVDRLTSGEEIEDKDLIAIAKLGFSLSEKVDKDIDEATDGKATVVHNAFNTLIMAQPEEVREALALDLVRRAGKAVVSGD